MDVLLHPVESETLVEESEVALFQRDFGCAGEAEDCFDSLVLAYERLLESIV